MTRPPLTEQDFDDLEVADLQASQPAPSRLARWWARLLAWIRA